MTPQQKLRVDSAQDKSGPANIFITLILVVSAVVQAPPRVEIDAPKGAAAIDPTGAGKIRYDLPRFQSALANSSPDKRSDSDQRDCGSLGSAGQVELRGLVSS